MRYRAISLENDQRRAHFAYFSTMQGPYVGLTAEVEAGAILGACHRNGWPFSTVSSSMMALATLPKLSPAPLSAVVKFTCKDTQSS